MSDDVIIGYDGRARCAWAGAGDTAFSRYHDEVHHFNVAKVAAMTDQKVDRLLQNSSIIRNRAKIKATVDNARAMIRVAEPAGAREVPREDPRRHAAIHCRHPLVHTTGGGACQAAESSGISLRGPTSVYAFMQ